MRRFNDTITLTLDTFRDFERGDLQYFDSDADLGEIWQKYFSSLSNDYATMQNLQRVLIQKIQTFDRMKDGVSK